MYISSTGTKHAYWKHERRHQMRRPFLIPIFAARGVLQCSLEGCLERGSDTVQIYHVCLALLARVTPSYRSRTSCAVSTLGLLFGRLELGSLSIAIVYSIATALSDTRKRSSPLTLLIHVAQVAHAYFVTVSSLLTPVDRGYTFYGAVNVARALMLGRCTRRGSGEVARVVAWAIITNTPNIRTDYPKRVPCTPDTLS